MCLSYSKNREIFIDNIKNSFKYKGIKYRIEGFDYNRNQILDIESDLLFIDFLNIKGNTFEIRVSYSLHGCTHYIHYIYAPFKNGEIIPIPEFIKL